MIFLPHFLYYTVPTFYLFGLLIMHNAAQHNYVISLTTEQKRRKHITDEFGKQNIPFEFLMLLRPTLLKKPLKI